MEQPVPIRPFDVRCRKPRGKHLRMRHIRQPVGINFVLDHEETLVRLPPYARLHGVQGARTHRIYQRLRVALEAIEGRLFNRDVWPPPPPYL